MVQTARPGRTDVHRRTLPDSLEALEDLDLVGGVLRNVRSCTVPVVASGNVRHLRPRRVFRRFVPVSWFHAPSAGLKACTTNPQISNPYILKSLHPHIVVRFSSA